MSEKIICDKSDLTRIADAVRRQNGESVLYNITQLGSATEEALKMPTLVNEGLAEDLVVGKQLINSNREIVNGANPYEKASTDNEVNAQFGLIEQISNALKKKGSGNGVELPTLTNEGID